MKIELTVSTRNVIIFVLITKIVSYVFLMNGKVLSLRMQTMIIPS